MLKIRELRQEEGLTQKELAERIGAAWYNIGDWERGKAEPSVRDMIRLADVFECSVDELIGREWQGAAFSVGASLSSEETKLLSDFRDLDERGRAFVLECLSFAASRK